MPKPRFKHNKTFHYTSNCDSLVQKIKVFYDCNQSKLSPEDTKKLLEYVQKIEFAKKVLDEPVRISIYNAITEMSKKYLTR